jgi:hypothetical protein
VNTSSSINCKFARMKSLRTRPFKKTSVPTDGSRPLYTCVADV